MHIPRAALFTSMVLVALVDAGCSLSTSGDPMPAGESGARWSCDDVDVPLGSTTECTSSSGSAITYDGTSTNDGPAYYCPPGAAESAACPPPRTGTSDGTATGGSASGASGTSDGAGSGGSATGGGTATGGTSDGTSADGAASGAGDGPAPPPDAPKKKGDGGPAGGAGGGAAGSGTSDGTSNGGGDAASATGGGSSGSASDGGYYCTREVGTRRCRLAPTCKPGAHRVQMDCESDASYAPTGTDDGESGYPGAGDGAGSLSGGTTQCFYPSGGASPGAPAATAEYTLEAIQGVQVLHVRLTFNPSFVDNTYGAGAVGWTKGHAFKELVGSDHAELTFLDKAGTEKLHFKMDYISQSASAPSGYACLGVTGGEGRMILGDASSVVRATSSLDLDLNARGYGSFTVDSPATTASYAPPANAPGWDFRVVYEAWVRNDAFGSAGFGSVQLAFVHASPSKLGTNTLPVSESPCPPDWSAGTPR